MYDTHSVIAYLTNNTGLTASALQRVKEIITVLEIDWSKVVNILVLTVYGVVHEMFTLRVTKAIIPDAFDTEPYIQQTRSTHQ